MDFDWPTVVEDNQNDTSRVGEGRVQWNVPICGYEEEKKKKKKKKEIDPFLDTVCPEKCV